MAAAPPARAPPPVVTLTDIRLPRAALRLEAVNAKQFGGFGPVIVAMIPVAVDVTPQSVLRNISADAVASAPKALSRILKAKPVIVVPCGMTRVFRTNDEDEVPSPRKSLLLTD
ncbi:hypothetical protein PIPA1_34470 [Pelosinus sp. IPA-1]|nr:hypothetical protein PIPA1_34470 [Pelosinus sp. IPA-1]